MLTAALLVAGGVALVAWNSLARAEASATAASLSVSLDEELEGGMREMNGALKAIGKGISAENRDVALEALSKFQRGAIAAKASTPGMAAKLDEKQRPEFVAEYRKMLAETVKLACDAEIAILDGKYKDADEILKNKLMGMKKAGHDKFQEEEEEGHGGKRGKH
ncbi:MAG: cytochrome b562 [Planctomycetes bacterium]|nr:cytochrome b562 [Planctomycetota bacterium]